jgi:hypothetical protein
MLDWKIKINKGKSYITNNMNGKGKKMQDRKGKQRIWDIGVRKIKKIVKETQWYKSKTKQSKKDGQKRGSFQSLWI